MRKRLIVERDYDIDVALQSFNRIMVVAEVKWKNYVPRSEIRQIEDRLTRFSKQEKYSLY